MTPEQNNSADNKTGPNPATSMVKGKVLLTLPAFIIQKYGSTKYKYWVEALSSAPRKIFSTSINKNEWYPLKDGITEPTEMLCNMFYNKSIRGAWDCGRFSAENDLKGIKKILVKLSSPEVLIKKASKIIQDHYIPSAIKVISNDEHSMIIRITDFPEMIKYVENRIGGWMERALQICGGKHIAIHITASLTTGDSYTEYSISWKKY